LLNYRKPNFLLKPDFWTDSSDNPTGNAPTQHEQRRCPELKQILETPSATLKEREDTAI
jgi:hypothetical protein